ncbi:START domain-containing protein [Mucilaginibacter sabulilitoris]|uniref:START domain-containing protein n=1 Tax=Mucilaginibacter sabulilitoris TaxID=1173583 RepID=A0ABZ0TKC8_9SPHI|nr:START domain-containing protein [Mucilaginibacter sabulilitoris]WPU92648.1 START domain-containing protein [Mucilaginibacter sabulilitoris]
MYKRITLLLLLLITTTIIRAEEPWALSSDKEGVKVYTRHVPNSKIKAIKVECQFNATSAQLVAVLLDIKGSIDWVYHTKSVSLIKQVSPSELYYYSEVNIPWPIHNRDFIAHIKVTQDPVTKVVTVDAPCIPDMVPVKDGIVRIEHSVGKWIITPVDSNHVKIEYTLHLDAGGSVPAWLLNMFITQGPTESFKKLKVQLQKSTYKNVKLAYIAE